MGGETTGDECGGLQSDGIGQWCARNEIHPSVQSNESSVAHTSLDCTVGVSRRVKLLTGDEAGLCCCASGEAPFEFGVHPASKPKG